MKLDKCCIFINLKIGLYVWGYLCLGLIYVSSLVLLHHLQNRLYDQRRAGDDDMFVLFAAFVGNVIQMIFHILLVTGLHMKNNCMLEAYNGYLIISMLLEAIFGALFIPLGLFRLKDINNNLIVFLLFAAAIYVIIDLALKFHILTCVRSYVSSLGYDQETQSVYTPEELDVFIIDNIKRRKKDTNLKPIEISDVFGYDRFDNKDDNLECKEYSGIELVTKNTSREDIDGIETEVAAIVHDSDGKSENKDDLPAREDSDVI